MDKQNQDGIAPVFSRFEDARGYLLFAAFLTPEHNENGNNIIDFEYRRYHFTLEDARQALQVLKGFIDKELENLMKAPEGDPWTENGNSY